MRPNTIPGLCQRESIYGITGADCARESGITPFGSFRFIPRPGESISYPKLYLGATRNLSVLSPTIADLEGSLGVTSYPHIAAGYFDQAGIRVDLESYPGSIEALPLVLKDVKFIVDIWSSGNTARDNNIRPIATIMDPIELVWLCGPSPTSVDRNRIADLQELLYQASNIIKC